MRTYNAGRGGESRITHIVGKHRWPANQYDAFRRATALAYLFVWHYTT